MHNESKRHPERQGKRLSKRKHRPRQQQTNCARCSEMEEHGAEVSRLLIRNDAEATLSTAPKFAESWRYRGRELLCVDGRAARAQNDSLSTARISEHSVVEHCAGRRLTNCHFRALDGTEMRIILM